MRAARADDHFRHVYSQDYSTRINRVSFSSVPGVLDGAIECFGGITALCGANGAGKSTLLQCLQRIAEEGPVGNSNEKLNQAHGSFDVHYRGQNRIGNWDLSRSGGDRIELQVKLLDPSRDCPKILNRLRSETNFAEWLAQFSPKVLERKDLAILSQIVGKEYTHAKLFELDDADDGDPVPYFQVSTPTAEYGATEMGLGEFSIFYLFWQFTRAEKGSVLLIEEPESFVSPRAQCDLMAFVAKCSDEKRLWIFLTTHSEHILEQIPRRHIHVLLPGAAGFRLARATSDRQYLDTLGLDACKRGILFTEDNAGAAVTAYLLADSDSVVRHTYELLPVGGDSKLLGALKNIPKGLRFLTLGGILDGDLRSSVDLTGIDWPIVFLPSNAPPEAMLIDAAKADPSGLATQLGRSVETVEPIIFARVGDDHHEFLSQAAHQLGIGRGELVFAMFRHWKHSHKDEADAFVTALETALWSGNGEATGA